MFGGRISPSHFHWSPENNDYLKTPLEGLGTWLSWWNARSIAPNKPGMGGTGLLQKTMKWQRVFLSLSRQVLCWQGLNRAAVVSEGFLDASHGVSNAETGGCSLEKQACVLTGDGRPHLPLPWLVRHGKTSLLNPQRQTMMCCELIVSKAMAPGTGLPQVEAAQMCR